MLGTRVGFPKLSSFAKCRIFSALSLSAKANAFHTFSRTLSKSSGSNTNSSVEDYYSLLLSQPLSNSAQTTRISATLPSAPLSPSDEATAAQKARIVFGSRLAGPAERQRKKTSQSSLIAGVLVPPRPEEPDNCCMSGCVNCVWEAYRDDMEEWVRKKAEAKRRELMSKGRDVGGSMDDDGGGSETNWMEVDSGGDDAGLFAGVPVGIREFMRTEKRLKDAARMRAPELVRS